MGAPQVKRIGVTVDMFGRGNMKLHGAFVMPEEQPLHEFHFFPGGATAGGADTDMVPPFGIGSDYPQFHALVRKQYKGPHVAVAHGAAVMAHAVLV